MNPRRGRLRDTYGGLPPWVRWLAVSGLVWFLYGLVRVVQFQAFYFMQQGSVGAWARLAGDLGLPLVIWAMASPAILAAALRWPLRPPGLLRGATLHGGLLAALVLGEAYLTTWWQIPPPWRSAAYVTTVLSILPTDFLTYTALVAVAQALVQKRSLLEAEAESLLQRAARERAESMALRMQLHPHFIMNALQAVAELIQEDPAAAESMVLRLEDMVAQTQGIGGQEEVRLTRELELVETYLAIQRYRLGTRLRVEMDVEEGLGDLLVPGFVLQPLVENAVIHGVARNSEGGTVRIHVAAEGEVLHLEVVNDCADEDFPMNVTLREGTGLRNTRLRLAQLYGGAHALSLDHIEGSRAMRAALSVPLRRGGSAPRVPRRLPGQGVVGGKEGELEGAAYTVGGQRLLTQA